MSRKILAAQSVIPVIVPVAVLSIGIVCFLLSFSYSTLVGGFLVGLGVVLFFYTGKNSRATPGTITATLYIASADKQKMIGVLESKDFQNLCNFSCDRYGTRMVITAVGDHSYATAQIFDYVAYEYIPGSAKYEFHGEDAKHFCEQIESIKRS